MLFLEHSGGGLGPAHRWNLQSFGQNLSLVFRQRSLNKSFESRGERKVVQSLSCVQLFVTPWTIAYKGPPSMEFSRQEYWSGLPFPSPGDLPNPGIEPRSPALQAVALPSEQPGKPIGFWAHPNQHNSSEIDCICQDPMSKYSHTHRSCVRTQTYLLGKPPSSHSDWGLT